MILNTRMKRFAALFLSLTLCISLLSGCASGKKATTAPAESTASAESTSPTPDIPPVPTETVAPSAETVPLPTETPAPSSEEAPAAPVLKDCAVMHELEFGGVYIDMTIDDFNTLGFVYGDSVDVEFSNGYKLEDLPYYNGYYTLTGDPLLVAYPGYPYIKTCINNGDDLWNIAALTENDTATVTLRETGKYADIQDARDIHYKDERDQFPSDEVFANFRAVSVSGLGDNVLYRSASPCDNQHNRAPYVDALIKEAGVQYILNLADNDTKIAGYIAKDDFNSPYFLSLYENSKVLPIGLNMNYQSADFRTKLTAGIAEMAAHDGPYLVHCTEGKDRTGFICLLLEALCGASYEEIVDDYMITYDNYYQITKEEKLLGASLSSFADYYRLDAEKVRDGGARYYVIVENVLDPMVRSLVPGDTPLDEADLAAGARKFLLDGGMSEEQVDALIAKLSK